MSIVDDIINKNRVRLPHQDTVSWLLAGDFGTGKTFTCSTARTPILFYMFDPGGADLPRIRRMEDAGTALVIRDFEQDDPKKPTAFDGWQKMHFQFKKEGVYERFGTVVIDNLTTFSRAAQNFALSVQGRAGGTMQLQDWGIFLQAISGGIKDCCSLPCDFILTSHLDMQRDDVTGSLVTSLSVSGQSAKVLPTFFSEVYITDTIIPNGSDKSVDYRVITRPYGRYRARTRIGSETFSLFEIPDLSALRAKAGRAIENKPSLGERPSPAEQLPKTQAPIASKK